MEKLATARSDESVVPGTNPGKDRHAVRCKCWTNNMLSCVGACSRAMEMSVIMCIFERIVCLQ
jgi:hypothetical protein